MQDAIASALQMLGLDAAQPVARSVVSEMVGAMALARATADVAEARAILESSNRAIKARLPLGDPA